MWGVGGQRWTGVLHSVGVIDGQTEMWNSGEVQRGRGAEVPGTVLTASEELYK